MLHVKIFSWVYVCAVRYGSTFSSRKSGLSLGKTVAPENAFVKSGVVFLGSVPYGNSRLIVTEGKPQQQTSHTGPWNVPLLVIIPIRQWRIKRKSYMLLSLIYADLFEQVFISLLFCSYQCKSTPMQVWKDKKSHVASFPSITDLMA